MRIVFGLIMLPFFPVVVIMDVLFFPFGPKPSVLESIKGAWKAWKELYIY